MPKSSKGQSFMLGDVRVETSLRPILQGKSQHQLRCERIAAGDECPACGPSDKIESNGEPEGSLALDYLHPACGAQWNAAKYRRLAAEYDE